MRCINDLITLFDDCFLDEFNTRLEGGASEPIYLPKDDACSHNRIVFTRDYYASALHEVAHWCVAGNDRRKLVDYGYWYAPDGRTIDQQAEFERVEIKPQALEWLFTVASGGVFKVSVDNLTLGLGASKAFKGAVAQQAREYCHQGLAGRPSKFVKALQSYYGQGPWCSEALYQVNKL